MYEIFVPKARNIIATDGGANFLYHSPFRHTANLSAIIGDLDSLDNSTK
jgi:thiamine pyrophosphokinase